MGNELRISTAVALKMQKVSKSESLGAAKACIPELGMQFERLKEGSNRNQQTNLKIEPNDQHRK